MANNFKICVQTRENKYLVSDYIHFIYGHFY